MGLRIAVNRIGGVAAMVAMKTAIGTAGRAAIAGPRLRIRLPEQLHRLLPRDRKRRLRHLHQFQHQRHDRQRLRRQWCGLCSRGACMARAAAS